MKKKIVDPKKRNFLSTYFHLIVASLSINYVKLDLKARNRKTKKFVEIFRFRQGFLRVYRFFFTRRSSDANDSSQVGGINMKDMPTEMRMNQGRSGVAHSRANMVRNKTGPSQNCNFLALKL